MPEENDLPPIGVIYETWLTTEETAEITGMSNAAVRYACIECRLRATKVGKHRGEWRIDPESAQQYQRRKPSP